jgi:hypothetical protein
MLRGIIASRGDCMERLKSFGAVASFVAALGTVAACGGSKGGEATPTRSPVQIEVTAMREVRVYGEPNNFTDPHGVLKAGQVVTAVCFDRHGLHDTTDAIGLKQAGEVEVLYADVLGLEWVQNFNPSSFEEYKLPDC